MHRFAAKRSLTAVSILTATALAVAACGNGGSGSSTTGTGANAQQTIVFATQGLGTEGDATKAAIAGFEKAHPNIHVQQALAGTAPTVKNIAAGKPGV